ncbi:MAG: hypothetical protein H0W49_00450 [Nitrospirales bacterium]|nr:hypothetical protein [Nitrospirales bacterium]MBA3966618.1 hypothetical protein [Nitrospirales bacterium]
MIRSLSLRTSLVLGLAVLTVAAALFLEFLLSVRADRLFGHTQGAHLVGWTGLVFIGLTFVYPLKRWMYPNQIWSQRWFQGVLKKSATGVLAPWPCSRTPPYAPLVQAAAAFPSRGQDWTGLFEHSTIFSGEPR